jgi:hypothetical protein
VVLNVPCNQRRKQLPVGFGQCILLKQYLLKRACPLRQPRASRSQELLAIDKVHLQSQNAKQ